MNFLFWYIMNIKKKSYIVTTDMIHKSLTALGHYPNTHKENCHVMYQVRCL